jgi:hypothetical protein
MLAKSLKILRGSAFDCAGEGPLPFASFVVSSRGFGGFGGVALAMGLLLF